MPRPIITDRLVLRPYRQADAPTLARLIAEADVQRWLPNVPHPYSNAEAEAFIDRAADDPWKLAITLDDALIGGIAVEDELGYWLGKPYWGRGYASEAAGAFLTEWFDGRSGDLASGHLAGNSASRNVLLKLGFIDTVTDTVQSAYLGGPVQVQRMRLRRPVGQVPT